VPITLLAALRLAQTSNLDIAQAQEGINQARARLERARVAVVPNLNIGSSYTHHEGQIQRTEGNVITANRDSLFAGGGPALSFQTTEAVFAPLAARQLLLATEAGLERVAENTLLAVAESYFNVLRARRRIARVQETLTYLVAERRGPEGQGFKGLLPLVRDFVEVGGKEAFQSDLARVEVEILRRREELLSALQDLRVATAELARLVRLDPTVPLMPAEDYRYPLSLPGEPWFRRPIEDLAAFALVNRPELAENQALVQAALERLRAAQYRPLLPNVALGYNWGDFGGSPDPLPRGGGFGPSGRINHFKPRTDIDVLLVWRLDNLGLGNQAERREQQAVHRQALLRQLQAQDLVIAQVVQAQEQVQRSLERVDVMRSALFDPSGAPTGPVFRSLRLNLERIRGGEGRPLEALDSVRGLSDSLEAYGQAITDLERARFRLLSALGLPAAALLDPKAMPLPPCDRK
jgi:outer membrane protein TolC